jgi:hypothetical protein
VINQLWGPLFDLTGDGGYKAWTIGDWFVMKYANIVVIVVIAVIFLAAMFINIPERKATSGPEESS